MVFSSISFLFFFLPAVIVVVYLVPRGIRNLVLVGASLAFYTWGTGWLVAVLVASMGANYVLGNVVERRVDEGDRERAKRPLALAVLLNVGLLAWFKYANFGVDQLNGILGATGGAPIEWTTIILPIGISFYTFHSLSYLVDIYRGVARHLRHPVDFALYITFFPQLVAGPIVRFHEIRDQIVGRRETSHDFARGIYRFCHGLGKKVLIADTVAPIADAAFALPPDQLNTATALVGVVAYTVQLYFDFSGYSDMALGLGAMFGFHLPENFNRPYASRSITEFWRRWHMSLSRWFRDYLYIPLGGNRGSSLMTYRNLILVFLATGIWHGANWTFLLWGAYHGALLLAERRAGIGRDAAVGRLAWLAQVRTVGLVVFGWILFRSPDVGHAMGYIGSLARPDLRLAGDVAVALDPLAAGALVLGIGSVLLPRDWVTGVRLQFAGPRLAPLRFAALAVIFPISLVFLVSGSFSPFLYFQF
jgi:alginate O-acetyltransferase complex protein AlgI